MARTWPHLFALCLLPCLAIAANEGIYDSGWRDDFATVDKWAAQPTWLSNACPEAKATTDGQVACFTVPTPSRGMKWGQDIPGVWVPETRFLVVRYRAEGLKTDSDNYFIYVNDAGTKETSPVRLKDMVADGKWHTVGVDLEPIVETNAIKALAIHVQAGSAGGARVWVDSIRFCDRLPAGCQEIRGSQHEPEADWWADLDAATWSAQPTWLPNPAQQHSVARETGVTNFTVHGGRLGMKWSWFFGQDIALTGRRYVCLRYRAANTFPQTDYALCVLGSRNADGKSYTSAIAGRDLRHDGHWHTLTLPVSKVAALFPQIKGLAIQVQSDAGPARLAVQKLGLVNETQPLPAQDVLAYETGGSFEGFAAIDLTRSGRVDVRTLLDAMNVTDWPFGRTLTVSGVPFAMLPEAAAVCATGLRERGELRIPVGRECSQVFLLTIGVLRGKEEQVYLRDGKITAVREIDRFRLRLEYSDGSGEDCFPFNATSGKFEITDGGQMLCAYADAGKRLERVLLYDRTDRAGFAVVAATCRTSAERLFEQGAEELPVMRPKAAQRVDFGHQAHTIRTGDDLIIDAKPVDARLSLTPLPRLLSLRDIMNSGELLKRGPSEALYEVSVDGKQVPPDAFVLRSCRAGRDADLTYETQQEPRVRLSLRVQPLSEHEIAFDASVQNLGREMHKLGLVGPRLGRVVLGDRLEDNYYVYPRRGWMFHNRPVFARGRYGGMFPLQFMAAFNPVAGSSVYLRTEDLVGVMRDYLFEKNDQGVMMWLEYPAQEVPAGGKLSAARSVVGLASGDWHDAFNAYVKWVKTWYKPLAPRKRWYREVFNFRQRFLYWLDGLYDAKAGQFHLDRALDEAEEHFGGMEYMHIFDWGNCGKYGRIYGRTGDYSPYDYLKGGKAAFKDAIAGIQKRGVPVGLYIEGYLLQENGKLGQAHGKDWQLVNQRYTRVYWPGSTEMVMCPWAPAWREVQASTYAAKVAELDVDGMYLDQFGFAGPGKDCWSRDHSHPVPGYSMLGERGLSTMVRKRIQSVKKGVALYGEETPCDVNSQVQDGSFTYHMTSCRWSRPLAPVHMLRFAIPSFKTFEILVCDRPTGTWAEGVKWVFFNGEGIWLEGEATEWFAPDTRAAIRKCHAILRAHKDAFTSDQPVPLVQTEMGGVYANFFPAGRKTVHTLYNSRHRTVRGEVLAIKARPGARYFDAWHAAPLTPTRRDGRDVISLTLGPRDVGCVVCVW